MSMVVAAMTWSLTGGASTIGVSDEAQLIAQRAAARQVRAWESKTLGYADVENNLLSLAEEAGSDNWDGYGAAPVMPESIAIATGVLRALPVGTSRPTVGAHPDGHVTLEWYASPTRTLSVSIAPDGMLHYAALLSRSSFQSGAEPFLGQIPRSILELVRRVSAA